MAEFEDVIVQVGLDGARHRKRFRGHRLAQWRHDSPDKTFIEVQAVYRTEHGRYAVHISRLPGADFWSDPATWYVSSQGQDEQWDPGDYSLYVYDTFDELKQHIPVELAQQVEENQHESPLEQLDI